MEMDSGWWQYHAGGIQYGKINFDLLRQLLLFFFLSLHRYFPDGFAINKHILDHTFTILDPD